jgi:hypothetical protein
MEEKETPVDRDRKPVGDANSPAWQEFERILAKTLGAMDNEVLVLEVTGTGRYVQFSHAPGAGVSAETVSNKYLKADERLTDADVAALEALGWSPPSPTRKGKRKAPAGSPNFWRDFPNPVVCDQVARLAVRTLVEVPRAPEPSALAYTAFHKNQLPIILGAFYGSGPDPARDLGYFVWKYATLKCGCGWSGSLEDASTVSFAELTEVNCPTCDARIGLASHPTFEETEEAAEAGDEEAKEMVAARREVQPKFAAIEKSKLRDPSELPDQPGEKLDFVWDWEPDSFLGRYLIRCGEAVVWSELARWEDFERFDEIKPIFKQKYGARFGSLTLTEGARCNLSGDKLFCKFDPS